MKLKVRKIIYSILLLLLMAFGVFMFIYGEYDDSPGGQGLGLISFIIGITTLVKIWRKKSE